MTPPTDFIRRLTAATPKKYVWRWLFHTVLYGCCILINEHYELIEAMGFSPYMQAAIRVAGTVIYMFLTTYSFQKINDDTTKNIQVPDRMAIGDNRSIAADDTPGKEDAQGDNKARQQSASLTTDPRANTAC